ncbi:P2Y purinoceptor 1-like [Salarias fasciatus]|uniref:P2Y purinoceptor 1-like n=1 Tax=Salarias fasciatus TaxID=181472 RepID=A0A672IW73_SALFA|nr:P2Y purinoceptor 1-like [Salarias fasciatus]
MSGDVLRNGTRAGCGGINMNFTHSLLPPVFVIVFVVGTLANVWGLRSVCVSWKNIGSINVFMLNLGLADLLYLSTLPFLVRYYATNSLWEFGQPFCKITRFCFNLNLYGSIGFLTCISIYRYLGIVHPMRVMGKIRTRHSAAISALVWALVVIQILPDMFFEKNDHSKPLSCFDTTSNNLTEAYLTYSLAWTATGFALPLLIILVCYGHIVVVLSRKSGVNPLLKQRSLKLVVILVILFSTCFIPYHVLRNLNLRTRILKLDGICRRSFDHIYLAHQVGRCLACLNSAINPLIYIVGNDHFLLKLHSFSQRTRQSLSSLTGTVIYRKAVEVDTRMDTRVTMVQVGE